MYPIRTLVLILFIPTGWILRASLIVGWQASAKCLCFPAETGSARQVCYLSAKFKFNWFSRSPCHHLTLQTAKPAQKKRRFVPNASRCLAEKCTLLVIFRHSIAAGMELHHQSGNPWQYLLQKRVGSPEERGLRIWQLLSTSLTKRVELRSSWVHKVRPHSCRSCLICNRSFMHAVWISRNCVKPMY